MNLAEQLAQSAEKAMKKKAKIAANNLLEKLIESADEGLFKLELLLKNETTEDKRKNEIAISKEFTQLLEKELDGVRVYGEIRNDTNLLGMSYSKYYWVFEWD